MGCKTIKLGQEDIKHLETYGYTFAGGIKIIYDQFELKDNLVEKMVLLYQCDFCKRVDTFEDDEKPVCKDCKIDMRKLFRI